MSKKNIMTSEGVEQFGRAMEQLKLSLEGIRSITENMIPERLFSTNFREYYTEMCNNISSENAIRINVNFSGEFQDQQESHRIKTYLAVRSLLSFIIAHTKPTQIDLLFSCHDNSIVIQAADNGKKYNLPVLTYPGIKESEDIRTRTESMSGIFTILDSQKEGNKLRISFNDCPDSLAE
jgi:signal transduction histidine kinase